MRCDYTYRTLLAVAALVVSAVAWAADISVELPEEAAIPGRPFVLSLRLNPGEEAIPVAPDTASMELPEGVTATWGPLIADAGADVPSYVQTLELRAEAIGDFEVDGLAYRFVRTPDQTKLVGEKLAAEENSFTISVEPVTVSVVRDWRPYVVGGASVVALVVLFAALFFLLRRSGVEEDAPGGTPAEQVQARLHQARQHRLDGDFYALYRAYAEAAKILSAHVSEAPRPEPLQQRAQEVGYRNERPNDDEMDGITNDLERALSRLKESA